MTRSRASAKQAGTRFESAIVDYLASRGWRHAERRAKTGALDKGDKASPADAYVVMDGETFTHLLREAGY